jgi:hypothetical protein
MSDVHMDRMSWQEYRERSDGGKGARICAEVITRVASAVSSEFGLPATT